LVTQLDKLLLSKLLPLTEYAYFTLAVVAAGGVTLIGAPVSVALLPRLAKLSAVGDEVGLVDLYRKSTQWVTMICVPAALTLACFAEQVLWAWTGDTAIAHKAAPVLRLYALGNGILVLAAFPYYLQFAKGDLKLHLWGNALFVLLLVPSLVWSAWRYGAFGAGCAWVALNAAYFVFWVPLVHARLMRGMHVRWLWRDVAAIALPALAGAALLRGLVEWPTQRASAVVMLMCVGLTLLAAAAAGSSWARRTLAERVLAPALNGIRR
jgi:O-antigen/teichoic acid export membrane protein